MQGQVVFLDGQEFNATDVALDSQRNALHAQIEAERQAKLGELDATKTDDLADKSTHVGEMTDSKYRQNLAEQVAFSTITLAFIKIRKFLNRSCLIPRHISPKTSGRILVIALSRVSVQVGCIS
ncbi:hypothetical protein ACSF85_03150 [Moraxella bovoculi]|uniref:hypothetical protein n=1 Tax=Moraxella bovoculi TaxID=386891 RepID=UPI003F4F6A24